METNLITVIENIINNFDFVYMINVNILTFFLIKTHDYFNGKKAVPVIGKRAYLVLSILLLGIIYYYAGEVKFVTLINSAILAPVFWSWIAAPILKKLGVTYKQKEDGSCDITIK